MKRFSIIIMSAALLASSCTTGAGTGAYAGSSLGSVLGSAIGGIIGGPHGSDVGTIVGMAGGAVVGGALGNAADQQQRKEQHEVLARRNQRIQQQKAQRGTTQQYNNDIYSDNFDPAQMVDNSNSGDDRIDFGTASTPAGTATNSYSPASQSVDASRVERLYGKANTNGKLTLRNVKFSSDSGNNKLCGGEVGHVTFEIYNEGESPVYNFEPSVTNAEDNKRLYISPSVRVENIMPGQGLRYTATVKADRRIKDGQTKLLVSAQKDGKPISYITVLKIDTQH